MKNKLYLLILIFFTQSCNDNNLVTNIDIKYPSSYSKLDSVAYNQSKADFARANPFLVTSITEFGFCGNYDFLYTAKWAERIPDMSKDEAINIVKSFVSQSFKQTGVVNPADLTFTRVDSSRAFDGSLGWNLLSSTQVYNGLEVYNSNIRFTLLNGKMTNCQGNWYPVIYVPSKINVDEEKVKSLLLNKTVYLSDIIGRPIPMTIRAKSFETATFTKLIYPVETTDKIELHVVWKVNIPDVFYVIFVDVMTGEMVGSYPTAIS